MNLFLVFLIGVIALGRIIRNLYIFCRDLATPQSALMRVQISGSELFARFAHHTAKNLPYESNP